MTNTLWKKKDLSNRNLIHQIIDIIFSRKNINYERDYYLPPSTPSTTEQVANARAKKIFILRLRIDRLVKWIVCRSKMIWVNILLLFKCGFNKSIVIMKRSMNLPGIWSPWMVLLQVALKICDFQFESQSLYTMICTSKNLTLEESWQGVIT